MYFNYIVPIYMLLSDMWLIVYIVYSVHNYDLLSANESGTCILIKENEEKCGKDQNLYLDIEGAHLL